MILHSANDAAVTTCIPGYTSIWGLDLQSYQIHARCILLDTKTGYRSQFLQVSGVVRLCILTGLNEHTMINRNHC